jgi:hypothetical protein
LEILKIHKLNIKKKFMKAYSLGRQYFQPELSSMKSAKHEKRVEGSKGTLLPELGLAFGLSEIGRTKLRVTREFVI